MTSFAVQRQLQFGVASSSPVDYKQNFAGMSPEVRAELLDFYANPNAPYATKRKPKEWTKVEVELQQLKSSTPAPVTADSLSPAP